MDFCLACDKPGDLIYCDICSSSFHLKCIGMKKKDNVGTSKDIEKNHHAVTSCQVYDKECETTSITEPNNVNQDERTRMNELRETSEHTPDIKLDLEEYIKECTKKQQQILSTDHRKNHKLLDVPIKRKKDTVTESSLVALEMKESSQQLETRTIELTKFRSNKMREFFYQQMKNYNSILSKSLPRL